MEQLPAIITKARARLLVRAPFMPSFLLGNIINPLERLDSRPDCRPKRSHVILNL